MLVPKGAAPNFLGERKIIQIVDDAALASMLNRLIAKGGEMLIDADHFSRDADKSTEAQGWLALNRESLQVRDDGLYGAPRWSSKGSENLSGGVFRFISPEFDPASVEQLDGNRCRVTGLVGAALTNRPNFQRLQKPLTNRDADSGIGNPNPSTMHKTALAALLGITATELEAIDEPTLTNRLNDIKTKAAKADTLQGELDTIRNREADEFIQRHSKVIPENADVRKHLRDTFLANRATAQVLVDGFAAAKPDADAEKKRRAEKTPLFNREDVKTPPDETAADAARAGKISAHAKELCNREPGLPWSTAWARASAAFPAD